MSSRLRDRESLSMRTEEFDFDLPRELIAQQPASPRDSARLLCVGQRLQDKHVRDLPEIIQSGDLLVTNDTRVLPARLTGRRTNSGGGGAKVEITLHRNLGDDVWTAFARPARKLKAGDLIEFGVGLSAVTLEKGAGGEVILRFRHQGSSLDAVLDAQGFMPLPPYIERPRSGCAEDRSHYQTIFAKQPGAVAAPTAGLHFTDELLERLRARGIGRVDLTLHVGGGTFLPVKADRIEDHEMHREWGSLSEEAAQRINDAKAAGRRIVAVGTTSLRLMESALGTDGRLRPFEGETGIFIKPGDPIRSADLLLTNFHLPRSTLFILVAAFSGLERMKEAYAHAKANGYRFYSYGDACLLMREDRIR